MQKILIIIILFFCMKGHSQTSKEAKANSDAIIISGNVRFTILTPGLIRLEWDSLGKFDDNASLTFINRNLPVPKFTKKEDDKSIHITTDKLVLKYAKSNARFSAKNLEILGNAEFVWKPGTMNKGNLKGTYRTLDGRDGNIAIWDRKDTLKLEEGIISRDGWTLIDDSKNMLFDNSDWAWVIPRAEGNRQDWYFFAYGKDYKAALFDFTQVAGKIPIPPRWAFGYWWSRYWEYSDKELRELLSNMERYDIPLDVLVIDMDWHTITGYSPKNNGRDEFEQWLGWTGYTWNRDLFPEPEKFLKWVRDKELKITMNIHPASGVPVTEEKYPEFAKAMNLDTTGKRYQPFEIADKKFAENYFKIILNPLQKMGVDFWWLDWQQWKFSKKYPTLSNTFWLNYCHFTDMERKQEIRPMLYHRWGGLGNHRYQIGFSGDAVINWNSLAYQPYFTSTASNVGYGYWSHDIGGHQWGKDFTDEQMKMNPELYTRWLQYGVFSPILRTHSTKNSNIYKEIWLYPHENFKAMYDAIQLRYALVPYIYTAARQAYETGISICRPMYYDYASDKEVYDFRNQYMFGDNLLVAPVISPAVNGLSNVKVWLPKGEWYEWFTGTMLEGGKTYERQFLLNEYPVYVKAGAIIPMYPKLKNLKSQPDELVISLFPGGNSKTMVYDDNGDDKNYKEHFAYTKISREIGADKTEKIIIHPREGDYKDMPEQRSYSIKLNGAFAAMGIEVDGKEYKYSIDETSGVWSYNADKLCISINIPKTKCSKMITVVVKYNPEDAKNSKILNAMIGKMHRIDVAGKYLKKQKGDISFINTLRLAEQTSSRIYYKPYSLLKELQGLEHNCKTLIEDVSKSNFDKEVINTFINYLK